MLCSREETKEHASTTDVPCRGGFIDTKRRDLFCSFCDAFTQDARFDKAVRGALELKRNRGSLMGKQTEIQNTTMTPSALSQETRKKQKQCEPSTSYVLSEDDKKTVTPLTNVDACSVPRGVRGVVNLGNTCFMSTVLHAVVHSPSVGGFYFRDGHCRMLCEDKRKPKRPHGVQYFNGTIVSKSEISEADTCCLPCELDNLVSEFYGMGSVLGNNQPNNQPGTPIVPSQFLHAWWQRAPEHLVGQGQQDAHEFFLALVSAAHLDFKKNEGTPDANPDKNLKGKSPKDKSPEDKSPEDKNPRNPKADTSISTCPCPMHKAFAGMLRSDVRCAQCGFTSTTLDETVGISLDVPNSGSNNFQRVTLEECLRRFIRPEWLGDNSGEGVQVASSAGSSFRCTNCSDTASLKTKQMSVQTFPRTLSVQMKRFRKGVKIDQHVQFPFELDVRPFASSTAEREQVWRGHGGVSRGEDVGMSAGSKEQTNSPYEESNKFQYDLYAVVVHSGGMESGHYVAFVKSMGSWFRCDDSRIMRAEPTQVAAAQAYMLFYHRV